MSEIDIRPAVDNDRAFISHTWLKNYHRESQWANHLDLEMFFRNHRHLIHKLLETQEVWVACDPAEPSLILGFICGRDTPEAAIVHYVYVRDKFRGNGVARDLFLTLTQGQPKPAVGTHWTHSARRIAAEKHPAVYNPYLLMDMT